MSRPLKVFLCHAHSDKDAVKILYARLKREGVDVWLDKEKLLPGADWEYEIRKAVRESDVVIVCLSKQFNQAGFRQKEVRIALEEADKKPEGEIFIIPARLEECDNLESLSKWHWVDLFESNGFQRLILALRIRADKIGATLRQRGTTISRQKNNAEQQDAEKERIEKALRDEEEQKRQRLAKEQSEQAENERAERERLDRQASEKAALEKAEREVAERLTREKDAADKLAHEKAEREKKERETAERIAREKIELAQAKQPVGRVSNPTNTTNEKASRAASSTYEDAPAPVLEKKRENAAPKLNVRSLSIGGIVFACLLLAVFGGNYFVKNINSTETESPAQVTPTITKTKTLTPAPTDISITVIPTASKTITLALTKTTTPRPPTFILTPGIGSTMISEKDGMAMVYVPAGEFMMGSDNGDLDEQPIHKVYLDAFWIDQTEVTNGMYIMCVEDGLCTFPSSLRSQIRDYYYANTKYNDFPVVYVSWEQANNYCAWSNKRLPSEAEWEKAARGTDQRTYPWGEDIDCSKANYSTFCVGDTVAVGSYSDGVSPYGVYDMAGNVWEWVNDWYSATYYQNASTNNPTGPGTGPGRIFRGGGWLNSAVGARTTIRSGDNPEFTHSYLGFRCSMDATP